MMNIDIKYPDMELELERTFDAPQRLVWEMWTNPLHTVKWFGCEQFRGNRMKMDVRVGGAWSAVLRSTDGIELGLGGRYLVVTPIDRLEFTFHWDADNPNGLPSHETHVTVTLSTTNGRTLVKLRHTGFRTEEHRVGHGEGWTFGFDIITQLLSEQINQQQS